MKNLYYFAIEYSIFSIIGVIFFVKSVKALRDKRNKNNVVEFVFWIVILIFMLGQACEVYKAIHRPVIRQYRGIYVRESHCTVYFEDLKDEDDEKSYDIAWLVKNEPLEKNEKYKVYYEKNTEIIVKLQKIP